MIRVHRSSLPRDEIGEVDGIPATGLSRTILDLAGVVSKRQLERAINEAEANGLTDRLSIPDLLERYPRHRGGAVLRSILADEEALRGVTANDFEEAFVALLDANELPRPRFNADLAIRGRFLRPDALWEESKLIAELDGREAHGTEKAFESDRHRDRQLLVEGWRVTRITWKQLRDEPEQVVVDLRSLLGGESAPTL